MPKKNKKSKKKTKPNVFVQANNNEIKNEIVPDESTNVVIPEAVNKKITNDITTVNYFPSELKKMGVITTAMIITLGILTILLG